MSGPSNFSPGALVKLDDRPNEVFIVIEVIHRALTASGEHAELVVQKVYTRSDYFFDRPKRVPETKAERISTPEADNALKRVYYGITRTKI